MQLLSSRVSFSTTVSVLHALINSQLGMSNYIASLCRECFFQLRQLNQLRSSLTEEATKSAHTHICEQPAWLLQRFVVRCQQRLAEKAADGSQSRSACCDEPKLVCTADWPHKLQCSTLAAACRSSLGTSKWARVTPVPASMMSVWLAATVTGTRAINLLRTITEKCSHGQQHLKRCISVYCGRQTVTV